MRIRTGMVVLHRWFGLFMALFLLVSGLTGAVISWDHELDAWLNPQFYTTHSPADPLPALQLAQQLEQQDIRIQVTYLPLTLEPGDALQVSVEPRANPETGMEYQVPFNQLALDPATGDIQGQRMWGEVSLARENLLPFLYKLHYSMHIPDGFGLELGVLFMGIVGMVWVLDCFVALWIAFPSWRRWRKSLAFRWHAGGYKLTFDLHRSGGVWIWLLLLLLAVTSVSMNLGVQVVRPLVEQFSPLTPSPFAERTPLSHAEPGIERREVVAIAQAKAAALGISAPAGGVFYSPLFDLYGVGFFAPGQDHGDGGLGNPWLYFDGQTGAVAGADIPGDGSAGDLFMQLQFPLHSGRVAGIAGRILVSCLGVLVAMLSLTGILIWLRKRLSRRSRAQVPASLVADTMSNVLTE